MAKARVEVDPELIAFVKKKARLLARKAGHTSSDIPDLEQDLLTGLLASGHDLDRADWLRVPQSVKFLTGKIIRHRLAAKRDVRRTRALHAGHDLAVRDRRRKDYARPFQSTDLAIDLETLLAKLPKDQQRLASLLRDGRTVAQAATEMARPRTTVSGHVEKLLRSFERAGLGQYLENRPSD
jgi:hypothetical protein